MRVVLTHPALQREGFDRRGAAVGRIFVESHVIVDLQHQRVQEPEDVAFRFLERVGAKIPPSPD